MNLDELERQERNHDTGNHIERPRHRAARDQLQGDEDGDRNNDECPLGARTRKPSRFDVEQCNTSTQQDQPGEQRSKEKLRCMRSVAFAEGV